MWTIFRYLRLSSCALHFGGAILARELRDCKVCVIERLLFSRISVWVLTVRDFRRMEIVYAGVGFWQLELWNFCD